MSQPTGLPLVSVVVPTYNRLGKLIHCLHSLHQSTYPKLEIIVVDDASPISIEPEVHRLHPDVRVIRNKNRVLLAASRNQGLQTSRGDYILFVDDDNIVDRDAITELVRAAQATSVGVVSPLIFYVEQRGMLWYAGSWMSPLSGIAVFPYRGESVPPYAIPYATSLFHDIFMVRRDVFAAVGLFDQRNFPIYLSEADFSERMKAKGFRALVVPSAKAWHDVPILKGGNVMRHIHITEPARAFYVARNRIIFVKKYRKLWQKMLFLLFFLPVISILHSVAILSSGKAKRVYLIRNYFGGVIAGLAYG